MDWGDLKYFLGVVRAGSTLGAARTLGVNQTTVARRIEALEADLGVRLFDRTQRGSRLTAAGEALVAPAAACEKAADEGLAALSSHARGLAGVLRVTSSEILAQICIAPALQDFRRLYPDIRVEVITTDQFLDISKGEADVALRGTIHLDAPGLVARKITDSPWALYCSRGYAGLHGMPRAETYDSHILIGADGAYANSIPMRWMHDLAPGARVDYRCNTQTMLVAAVKSGLGMAPMPCLMGDREEDLIRCSDYADFPASVWMLTTPELKDEPRVRAFIDYIIPAVQQIFRDVVARAEGRRAGGLLSSPSPGGEGMGWGAGI